MLTRGRENNAHSHKALLHARSLSPQLQGRLLGRHRWQGLLLFPAILLLFTCSNYGSLMGFVHLMYWVLSLCGCVISCLFVFFFFTDIMGFIYLMQIDVFYSSPMLSLLYMLAPGFIFLIYESFRDLDLLWAVE